MGERELKEQLEQLNSEIQSAQKDIDSTHQAIKKREKEKESEKALKIEIQKAQELLKSLKNQKGELDKQLNEE